jgi:hypothetical protein
MVVQVLLAHLVQTEALGLLQLQVLLVRMGQAVHLEQTEVLVQVRHLVLQEQVQHQVALVRQVQVEQMDLLVQNIL